MVTRLTFKATKGTFHTLKFSILLEYITRVKKGGNLPLFNTGFNSIGISDWTVKLSSNEDCKA